MSKETLQGMVDVLIGYYGRAILWVLTGYVVPYVITSIQRFLEERKGPAKSSKRTRVKFALAVGTLGGLVTLNVLYYVIVVPFVFTSATHYQDKCVPLKSLLSW